MSTSTDINAFLMGDGTKSAKFENVGDKISGTITAAEVTQQTSIDDGTPKTFDNGDPMMQLVVTIVTDLREDDDDEGTRKLYLKGSKPTTSLGAVREAIKAAGAKGLEIGGTLSVAFTGEGEPIKRGFNPPKYYAAKYTPPPALDQAAVDDIFGD